MASSTGWTWVWASSGSCWCTGKPGVLHSMGSQRIGHYWANEQQQIFNTYISKQLLFCHLCFDYTKLTSVKLYNSQLQMKKWWILLTT